MKSKLFLAIVLLLTTGLAWAEEPAGEEAVPMDFSAPGEFALEGGGCELPDLAGLSDDEIEAAVKEAGFEISSRVPAQVMCPTSFSCSSITNCAKGPVCAATNLGPCCSIGGVGLCCVSGSIKVVKCPCQCSGSPCSITCPNSTDVRWGCS